MASVYNKLEGGAVVAKRKQTQKQQKNVKKVNQQLNQGLQGTDDFYETAEELSVKGQNEHGARKQKKNPEKGV